jgi:polyphosphate kinase 2 (PPK2 family)
MLDVIDMNVSTETETSRKSGDVSISKVGLKEEVSKQVVRKKLAKQRHLVIEQGINPAYLDSLFPRLLELFDPQVVHVSVFRAFHVIAMVAPKSPNCV